MAKKRSSSASRPRRSNVRKKPAAMQLNRSITSTHKERKAARNAKKAEYLASLPKEPIKRLLARMRPSHLIEFWFSRDGAIMSLKIIGIFIVLCFLLIVGMFAYFKKDILAFNSIDGANLGGSISYYDRTGNVLLWQDYNSIKRIPVSLNNISPYMQEATVAIEDKHFYHEGGFDFMAILRSGVHDILHSGGGLQGASTITEQVVKLNKGWQDPLSIQEKIEEIGLSVVLSRDYSKHQILNAYLNIAPYGNIDYGVQAAAEDYFHTTAANLTLAQAAMLASIPQAPTAYSPYSSPVYNPAVTTNYFDSNGLSIRAHYVLDLMAQQGYITQAQANAAKQVNVLAQVQSIQSEYSNIKYPYFDLAAKQQLINTYGTKLISKGTWKVDTTLSVPLQDLADKVTADAAPIAARYGADEEALVAEQVQTGQVVALVGGENFNSPVDGQINYAQININPGSTIKPYVYSTLINNSTNVGAGSVLYDVQEPLPGYPCTNHALPSNGGNCLEDYDFRYPGATSIRYALAGSRNVPAVKAGLIAGLPKIQATASAMMGYPDAYRCYQPNTNVFSDGKAQEVPCYGSAAIGDGFLHLDQTVNGLATLARLGKEIPQTYILSITDASGHSIYQWTQPKPVQAIKTDTAYIIDNMLSDPRASYLPGSCSATTCTPISSFGYKWQRYNGWDIAVKTGTTNSGQSGLMAGWNTQYAVASWGAYHTVNKPLTGAMEYFTEPMTRNWMQGALSMLNTKPVNWVQPSDIKVLPAFVQTVHVGLGSEEPGPSKELFPSWYTGHNSSGSNEVIDKVSGGIATSCTPADAKESLFSGGNAQAFSIDEFWPINQSTSSTSTGSTTSTYDTVHQCSDTMPNLTVTVSNSNGPINSTSGVCSNTDNSRNGCQIVITASQGTHPLNGTSFGGTVDLSINNTVVKTFNLSDPALDTVQYNYVPTASGTATISATVTDSVLYQYTYPAFTISTSYVPTTTTPAPTTP